MATPTLETIHLSHMPSDLPIYAALYRDVKNAAFLHEQLLAGNAAFEYAFIDASMVLSRTHALAAVFRALNDHLNNRLKSRNIHAETVFSFSPNNNIGESFRRFGIQPSTTSLLVVKIGTVPSVTAEAVQSHLNENIEGTSVPFTDEELRGMADGERLRKVYKLSVGTGTGGKGQKGQKGKGELGNASVNCTVAEKVDGWKEMELQVLGVMALRGAA